MQFMTISRFLNMKIFIILCKLDIIRNISAFLILLAAVKCYPITETTDKLELKEEMKFPNGTVVGKYAYMDKEGNPVQVKYYADEASYGVELNSIKVVDANAVPSQIQLKTEKPSLNSSDPVFDPSLYLLDSSKYPGLESKKYKASDSLQSINKDYNKKQESTKTNPDYEIYLQTDLNVPKKCNKEKVRVYNFEKDKRKIRNAYNMYDDAAKFCEQF